jgi:hypothetical protein
MSVASLCLCSVLCFWIIDLGPHFSKSILDAKTNNHRIDLKTELVCSAFQKNLSKSAIAFYFHMQIPRDQNDYTVFSADEQSGDFSFVVNEQRQIVFYVRQQNSGYELTDLGNEMYRQIAEGQKKYDGSTITDFIDAAVIFETTSVKGEETIQITTFGGNPSPSTVIIDIPKALLQKGNCNGVGRLGIELQDSDVGLEILVRNQSTTVQSIALRRSSAAIIALLCLVLLGVNARVKSRTMKILAGDE